MSEADAEATAAVFKALADPARVRLLNLLATAEEPTCVCQLTPAVGLSQPTVSHHLKKLVRAGLVRREQRGVWAYYSVDREALSRAAAALELEGATV
jgi:ArsR family transcriptional regulator